MMEGEVRTMNDNKHPVTEEQAPDPMESEKDVYTPRPRWQIILAWVALAIFVTGVFLYHYHFFIFSKP